MTSHPSVLAGTSDSKNSDPYYFSIKSFLGISSIIWSKFPTQDYTYGLQDQAQLFSTCGCPLSVSSIHSQEVKLTSKIDKTKNFFCNFQPFWMSEKGLSVSNISTFSIQLLWSVSPLNYCINIVFSSTQEKGRQEQWDKL